MTHVNPTTAHVHLHGAVGPGARAYAVAKLAAALRQAPGRIISSWLTIDSAAPGNRVDAYANVNGVHVHVHAVGGTLHEAIDLMQQRLRARLRHIRRRPAQGPPAPIAAGGQPVPVRPGPEEDVDPGMGPASRSAGPAGS